VSHFLLTAAMPQEAELISARLEPADPVGRHPAWRGRLGKRQVRLVLTGMGMVNAAQATTAALEDEPDPAGVINFGCAGAYADSGLALGEAALATEVVLADMGVRTSRRLHGLETIKIPLVENDAHKALYNRLPVAAKLSASLAAASPGLAQGVFATVAQVSGDDQVAQEVGRRWGAMLEEMEAAAVAQVAAHYGLAFAAVRGVSNMAGRRQLDLRAGAEAAQRVILAWGQGP
jgi:futalosine hydrolase